MSIADDGALLQLTTMNRNRPAIIRPTRSTRRGPRPRVWYEACVRHALRKYSTLLIRNNAASPMSDDGDTPFDLNDLRFISYTADDAGLDAGSQLITKFLLASIDTRRTDSPVHSFVPYLNVSRRGSPLTAQGYRI